jgi:predicted phosphohydrolase
LVDFRLHLRHPRLHLFDESPQLLNLIVSGVRLWQSSRRNAPSQEESGS